MYMICWSLASHLSEFRETGCFAEGLVIRMLEENEFVFLGKFIFCCGACQWQHWKRPVHHIPKTETYVVWVETYGIGGTGAPQGPTKGFRHHFVWYFVISKARHVKNALWCKMVWISLSIRESSLDAFGTRLEQFSRKTENTQTWNTIRSCGWSAL